MAGLEVYATTVDLTSTIREKEFPITPPFDPSITEYSVDVPRTFEMPDGTTLTRDTGVVRISRNEGSRWGTQSNSVWAGYGRYYAGETLLQEKQIPNPNTSSSMAGNLSFNWPYRFEDTSSVALSTATKHVVSVSVYCNGSSKEYTITVNRIINS